MELNQYNVIVAIARLCGVTGTKNEVYDKFFEMYKSVCNEQEETKTDSTEVFKRPY